MNATPPPPWYFGAIVLITLCFYKVITEHYYKAYSKDPFTLAIY